MEFNPKLKWNANDSVINRLTKSYLKRSISDIKDAVERGAMAGANATVDYKILGIVGSKQGSSTGTLWHLDVNTNKRPKPRGYGARVDTGNMMRSVGYSKASGKVLLSSTYGLPLNGPEYFFEQEYGFDRVRFSGELTGDRVPGMADEHYGHQENIDKQIKRAMNKSMTARGFFPSRAAARYERVYKMAQDTSFNLAWSLEFGRDTVDNGRWVQILAQRRERDFEAASRAPMAAYAKILRTAGKAEAEAYRKRLGL